MASYDDLDTKRIFIVGIFSVVVTAVTALAVQVVYYALEQSQQESKSLQSNYGRQNRILAAQSAEISQYGVDETTGNFTIPVDKAMALMLANTTADAPAENHSQDSHADAEHKADDDAKHAASDKKEAAHSEEEREKDEAKEEHAEPKEAPVEKPAEKEAEAKQADDTEAKPEESSDEASAESEVKPDESNDKTSDKDEA